MKSPLGLRKVISSQKTSKNQKLEKHSEKIPQQNFSKSSVGRIEKKRTWPSMVAKRFVPAKNHKMSL